MGRSLPSAGFIVSPGTAERFFGHAHYSSSSSLFSKVHAEREIVTLFIPSASRRAL